MSLDGSKTASPEERLLRLIRDKQPIAVQVPVRTAPSVTAGRPGLSGMGWRLPAWWLTALNVGLGGVVAGELIVAFFIFATPARPTKPSTPSRRVAPSERLSPRASPPGPRTGGMANGVADAVPSLASAVSRPLFQTVGTELIPGSAAMAPSAQAGAVTARLTLMGIVTGNPPQAIIEDAQTKKSYFVTVGQGLLEGVTVEAIRPDRVVLNLHGEKIELSL